MKNRSLKPLSAANVLARDIMQQPHSIWVSRKKPSGADLVGTRSPVTRLIFAPANQTSPELDALITHPTSVLGAHWRTMSAMRVGSGSLTSLLRITKKSSGSQLHSLKF